MILSCDVHRSQILAEPRISRDYQFGGHLMGIYH